MKLLFQLQKALTENYPGLIDSLRLSGIDAVNGIWDTESVDRNAQAGAISLIRFASQAAISPKL